MKILAVLLVCFLALALVGSALAQLEPGPDLPGPGAGADVILAFIGNFVRWIQANFIGSFTVLLLVALFKRIPGMDGLSGAAAFVFAVIVGAIFVAVNYFGFTEEASEVWIILERMAQFLLTFVPSLAGAAILYRQAVKQNVPVVGFQRSAAPARPSSQG